jgi:tetratricopeptide (TPR) repeat protein
LADLGAVCEGAGRYDRARQVYEQLLDREPENEKVRRKLEGVKAHLGLAPGLGTGPSSGPGSLENIGLTSEALSGTSNAGSAAPAQASQPANTPLQMPASHFSGQPSASRPSATASAASASSPSRAPGSKVSDNGASGASNAAETPLDDATQQFITQSLTDVDLFSSYGLTQKAIDLLEVVIQRAPRHTASIERLLDLYLGAGNERRTAELASLLQEIHIQNGDPASADRFAELRRRYERAAGLTSEQTTTTSQAAAPEFEVPLVEAEPLPDEEAMPEAKTLPEPQALASASPIEAADFVIVEPGVHEVDLSEEWAALAGILTDAPTLEESPQGAAAAVSPEVVKSVQQPEPQPVPDSISGSDPELTESAEGVKDETIEIPRAALENIPELDSSEFALELEPSPETANAVPTLDSDGFLSSLSADLDPVLPGLPVPEVPVGATAAPTPRAASQASAGPLGDVFDQFKADMGEGPKEDEDLETHYNLGIAYREMGLLEEAISEFQKVAKANQQGQPFRYSMQCCTLLGLAFMDKSQPGIAAMWYERALETPGLDQESILALRYDLGVAQELAGEMSAARKSFSQVYGMNIDYRDVAERLGALGKGS